LESGGIVFADLMHRFELYR